MRLQQKILGDAKHPTTYSTNPRLRYAEVLMRGYSIAQFALFSAVADPYPILSCTGFAFSRTST